MAKMGFIMALLFCLLHGASLLGQEAFDVEQLPLGKDITIPRPATTFIPLNARITLAATDYPQTLQFKPVNTQNGPLHRINLAIYDRKQERVQYVDLKPGLPFLYTFKKLSSILVIPEVPEQKSSNAIPKGLKLQVESDKPLSIKR